MSLFSNAFSSLPAVGTLSASLSTKATEGMKSVVARFGSTVPFIKAGAKTPTFALLASPGGLDAIAKTPFGATFTTAGLLSTFQQNNLFGQSDTGYSAVSVNIELGKLNRGEDRTHIVKLVDGEGNIVEFLVMPEIVENRNISYEAVAPAQFPGAFQKYKGTDSVQWSINALFVARTTDEATDNLRYINRLRGWSMPYFGENTAADYKEKLGAPPPVLKFSGWRGGILGERPVVITSLNWNWPRDVDYIPARATDRDGVEGEANIPFPSVMSVAIQVVESFSTTEFNQFSLKDYRAGDMANAYGKRIVNPNDSSFDNVEASRLSRYGIPPIPEAQTVGNGAGQVASPSDSSFDIVEAKRLSRYKAPPLVTPALSELKTADGGIVSGGGGDYPGGGAQSYWRN